MTINRNPVPTRGLLVSCAPAVLTFVVAFLIPLILVLKLAFSHQSGGITLQNFVDMFTDEYYAHLFVRTFKLAALVMVAATVLGTFEAYYLTRLEGRTRMLVLMAILGPLFISVVVRTLGWQILLGKSGPVSKLLQVTGMASGPPDLLYGEFAIFVGLLHMVLPYMVLNVWAALMGYDAKTESAARSLGAETMTVFTRVVLPQIMPGVLSGALTVFALSMSAFATPALLGGRTTKVVSTAVYDEFLTTFNWNLGATIALTLLAANLFVTFALNKVVERRYKGVFA